MKSAAARAIGQPVGELFENGAGFKLGLGLLDSGAGVGVRCVAVDILHNVPRMDHRRGRELGAILNVVVRHVFVLRLGDLCGDPCQQLFRPVPRD